MLRYLLVIAMTTLGAAGLLAGCGSGAHSAPSGPKVVDITLSPAGPGTTPAPVEVRPGQSVELEIHADGSGSIVVGSSPSQTVEYHAGTTQASVGPFTRRGRIAVRQAKPTATVVTLLVR